MGFDASTASWGTVLDAPDATELARFYSRLLGWPVQEAGEQWATVKPADGRAYLGFQTSPEYEAPAWPAQPGRQQMMLHLDIAVDDLEVAGRHAVGAGAVLADFQPQPDVRVFLDPAGHPFCLFLAG